VLWDSGLWKVVEDLAFVEILVHYGVPKSPLKPNLPCGFSTYRTNELVVICGAGVTASGASSVRRISAPGWRDRRSSQQPDFRGARATVRSGNDLET